MIELTRGQAELLDRISSWFKDSLRGTVSSYKHPQWFAYSGAAGCGKTPVIKEFIRTLGLEGSYVGCAYTGKAVLNMLKQGLNAQTIHSLIYNVVPKYQTDPFSNRKSVGFEFELKTRLDRDYDLIVVDEAPMVNDEMCQEILSFGIPVIFVGDMNQLPPVFGKSTVMENPDFILTQIMRQSEDNPIVMLSQMILKDIPLLEGKYGDSEVVREYAMDKKLLTDYDQILCFTNHLRYDINCFCRKNILGYETPIPRINDKIICRQNNWSVQKDGFYLTNGTSGYIVDLDRSELAKGYYLIDFHPDYFPEGENFKKLKVDARYLKMTIDEQRNVMRTYNEKFEYGYAITVHLSQGSEYDRVLFIDSFFNTPELTRKARYTAITRAVNRITIVSMTKPTQR